MTAIMISRKEMIRMMGRNSATGRENVVSSLSVDLLQVEKKCSLIPVLESATGK